MVCWLMTSGALRRLEHGRTIKGEADSQKYLCRKENFFWKIQREELFRPLSRWKHSAGTRRTGEKNEKSLQREKLLKCNQGGGDAWVSWVGSLNQWRRVEELTIKSLQHIFDSRVGWTAFVGFSFFYIISCYSFHPSQGLLLELRTSSSV